MKGSILLTAAAVTLASTAPAFAECHLAPLQTYKECPKGQRLENFKIQEATSDVNTGQNAPAKRKTGTASAIKAKSSNQGTK